MNKIIYGDLIKLKTYEIDLILQALKYYYEHMNKSEKGNYRKATEILLLHDKLLYNTVDNIYDIISRSDYYENK